MAFVASLNLTLGRSLFLCVYLIAFASAIIENSNLCEVFTFENRNHYGNNSTVVCETVDKSYVHNVPTIGSLKIDCKQGNATDSGRKSFPRVTTVISEGCVLRPKLFGFLHLPQASRFLSSLRQPNTVLLNNSFEGLCQLKELILRENDIKSVESEAFHCAHFVEFIDMSRNLIETFPDGMFKCMHHLRNLNLEENSIRELPPGIFDDLTSLRSLKLQMNSLTRLPDGIFRHPASLEVLDMRQNRLEYLQEDTLWNLAELRFLDISRNNLTNLTNVVSRNTKLRHLAAEFNIGLTLDEDMLVGLGDLTDLRLDACDLLDLPDGFLRSNANLLTVSMRMNSLKQVGPNTFSMLGNLRDLDLGYNEIIALVGSPFRNNSQMIHLFLQHNRISHIGSDSFRGLTTLQVLNLESNAIEYVDPDGFLHLVELRDLDMKNNTLRRLTNAFLGNGKLKTLNISSNAHLELDNFTLAGLSDLKHLKMKACNIDFLPGGLFAAVRNLTILFMQNNNLKEISAEAFGWLENLKYLDMNFNNITALKEKPFSHNSEIRDLRISNNRLSQIKCDDFEGLSSLEKLDVSHNSIVKIHPESLDKIPKLRYLEISHNRISRIEGYAPFRYNTELRVVEANHNLLTTIRNIKWHDMPSLNTLSVNHNRVTEFFLPLNASRGQAIFLQYNRLQRIAFYSSEASRKTLSISASKTRISLEGNPLLCDCDGYKMYSRVKKITEPQVEFVGDLHCKRPVLGSQLDFTVPTELICNETESCPKNCSCAYSDLYGSQIVNCSNAQPENPSNETGLETDRNQFTTPSVTENSNSCEVFAFKNRSVGTEIACLLVDKSDPLPASESDILKNDCEQEEGNSSDSERKSFPNVTAVMTDGCFLTPKLFGFLRLPNALHFNSSNRNRHPILLNNSFEGLCQLRQISLSRNNLKIIEPEAFNCVHFLKSLDLSRNAIETLPSGVFKGMRHLRVLYLGANNIHKIPHGVFDDLTSLRVLRFRNNSLSRLPDGIFRHLTSLEVLGMSTNRLQYLQEDTLWNLEDLRILDISRNNLTNLTNVVSRNTKLRHFDADFNGGLALNGDMLVGLGDLTVLRLDECYLGGLPDGLLSKCESISSVSLKRNKLEEIGPNVFGGLRNLRDLFLSDNDIHSLSGSPFLSNSRLKALHLENNKLSQIKFDTFRGLTSLEYLDMASNAIQNIDPGSFHAVGPLVHLDMSDNLISSLRGPSPDRSVLWTQSRLRYLYMRNNKLRRLTNAFMGNRILETLDISYNSKLELDDQMLAGLFFLRYLNMDACNIKFLPVGLFKGVQRLTELSLKHNRLKEISFKVLGFLKNLTYLHLDFNNIAVLEGQTFVQNRAIQYLYMSNNQLSQIKPGDWEGLSSLTGLDVSHNRIEKLCDESFRGVPQLFYLNISHNRISEIEGSRPFRHNKRIGEVNASHNILTDIGNIKWHDMPSLKRLHVDHNRVGEFLLPLNVSRGPEIHLEWNQIQQIDVLISDDSKNPWTPASKTRIYLEGNPLLCDCDDYKMYTHVKEITKQCVEFLGGDLPCQRQQDSLQPTELICDDGDPCPDNCSCTYSDLQGSQIANCSNVQYANLTFESPPNPTDWLISRRLPDD